MIVKGRFWAGSGKARQLYRMKVVSLWKEMRCRGKKDRSLTKRDWYQVVAERQKVNARHKVYKV